jgi:peroxiredoxin family protein
LPSLDSLRRRRQPANGAIIDPDSRFDSGAPVWATRTAPSSRILIGRSTSWGLSVLKKERRLSGKTLHQKMMALMSPGSSRGLPVSRMNCFGTGARMLRSMMKAKNLSSLEEMISLARELGVRIIACEMSRDLLGIRESELVDGLECGGVASFLADALKSRTSLFI